MNKIVTDYFLQIEPLIRLVSGQNIWLVYDGLKPKLLTWPGKKKHSYHWPFIADECFPEPRKELEN